MQPIGLELAMAAKRLAMAESGGYGCLNHSQPGRDCNCRVSGVLLLPVS